MENIPNQAPMPPPQAPVPPASGSKNTGMAIIAYLGILVIIPLVTDAKNDPFVKFHAKQGLALLILWVASVFIWIIPFFGFLIGWLLWLGSIVLMIIGIVNAANGQMKELPLIGSIGNKFNF